jgi:CRP/FNR family transcriptional regulator, nitrogen oxide reductase regulator
MELRRDIERSRVFDGLTADERAVWLAAARPKDVDRGTCIARQDEPARCFYLVESGFLKLTQLSAEGHELVVRFVGPTEPFGGVAALDGAAYPVTAVAVELTRLQMWPVETMRPLLPRFPQVRVNIMREMTEHMTDALTRVRELSSDRVSQRLAHAILRLMRQCGRPTPDGVLLAPSLTLQEFADLTGTTLYTVSRTLSQWKADGILRKAGRRLVVVSPEHLEGLTRER